MKLLFLTRPSPMAGQPTAASLQQSGTEQEELLDLQSRWLDLRLSAESQNIDFCVWNVMFLEISKVSLPQQITRLGRLLHQLEAHLLNRAKKIQNLRMDQAFLKHWWTPVLLFRI